MNAQYDFTYQSIINNATFDTSLINTDDDTIIKDFSTGDPFIKTDLKTTSPIIGKGSTSDRLRFMSSSTPNAALLWNGSAWISDLIDTVNIKNAAIVNDKITDLTIQGGKVANNTLPYGKLSNASGFTALLWNPAFSGQWEAAQISGNYFLDNSITTAKIANGAVSNVKLAPASTNLYLKYYSSGLWVDGTLQDGSIDANMISFNKLKKGVVNTVLRTNAATLDIETGQITNDYITNGTIAYGKLAPTTGSRALLWNPSTIQWEAAAITTNYITDLNITNDKIADLTIQGGKVANATLPYSKLQNGTVGGGALIWGGSSYSTALIDTANINNSAITTAKIAALNITEPLIAANAITTAKIAALNITEPLIAANAITTAKILNKNITYAKLQDGTSPSGGFMKWNGSTWFNDALNNADIPNNTISPAKLQNTSPTNSYLLYDNTGNWVTSDKLILNSGTVSTPAIRHQQASGATGLWFANNTVYFATDTATRLTIGTAQIIAALNVQTPNGTAAAPALRGVDANTGIYFNNSPEEVKICSGGADRVQISNSTVIIPETVEFQGRQGFQYSGLTYFSSASVDLNPARDTYYDISLSGSSVVLNLFIGTSTLTPYRRVYVRLAFTTSPNSSWVNIRVGTAATVRNLDGTAALKQENRLFLVNDTLEIVNITSTAAYSISRTIAKHYAQAQRLTATNITAGSTYTAILDTLTGGNNGVITISSGNLLVRRAGAYAITCQAGLNGGTVYTTCILFADGADRCAAQCSNHISLSNTATLTYIYQCSEGSTLTFKIINGDTSTRGLNTGNSWINLREL